MPCFEKKSSEDRRRKTLRKSERKLDFVHSCDKKRLNLRAEKPSLLWKLKSKIKERKKTKADNIANQQLSTEFFQTF